MSTSLDSLIQQAGRVLTYDSVGLVVQTFFFGIYSLLIVLSTRALLARGLTSRTNYTIFSLTLLMYLLSAAYWGYSVQVVAHKTRDLIHNAQNPSDFISAPSNSPKDISWYPIFNDLVLVNYIFTDAIVIWRAWIISARNYRRYLFFTIFFWILTSLTVPSSIVVRIIIYVDGHSTPLLSRMIDILQICNLGFSLLSNLSATAVVGATALRHRRVLGGAAMFSKNKKGTKAERILVLLIESGLLYCVSGLTVIVASVIRLPAGTVGDLYTPINVQIAGAYPLVVILLVNGNRSLNETTFLEEESAPPSGQLRFEHTTGPTRSTLFRSGPETSIRFARNSEMTRTTGTNFSVSASEDPEDAGADAGAGSDIHSEAKEKTGADF